MLSATVPSTSATLEGLTPNAVYFLRVLAANTSSISAYSGIVQILAPLDFTPPAFNFPQVSVDGIAWVSTDTVIRASSAAARIIVQDTGSGLDFNGLSAVPGTIGLWHLDEFSGAVAHDSSANGYNGALQAAAWTPGHDSAAALQFDGSAGSLVNLGTLGASVSSSARLFTVEAWVQVKNAAGNSFIVSQYQGIPPGGVWGWYLHITDTGHPEFVTDNSQISDYFLTCSGAIADVQWHHVAVAYSGGPVKIYLDGTLCGSGISPTGGVGNAYAVTIGAGITGAGSLNGKIDDVRILNFAESAAQIAQDIQGGIGTGASARFTNNAGQTWTPVTLNADSLLYGTTRFVTLTAASVSIQQGVPDGTNQLAFAARDRVGNMGTSTFTLRAPPVPAAPMGLAVLATGEDAAGRTYVTAIWNPVVAAVSYTLQASTDSSFSTVALSTTVPLTTAALSGVTPNATYYLRVAATSDVGISTYSAAISTLTPIDLTSPQPPALVGASGGAGGRISLSW
ncbi:MAG: LamG-like jellyroll fold domain-containing protein, partial [Elusimicrobiota bacterium]